jgi:CRISPR-associated exonuclease Cas4
LINNRDTIDVSYQLESSQFLGAKNIAQSLFGEVLYIPAVTIASSELITKGGSLFNKLYSKVASKITENNPLYEKASAALAELINSMNRTKPDGSENNERPEELKRLEQLIASELVTWRSSLEIEFKVPHVDDAIKLDTSIMVHDGVKTDIDRKGNGLQRSLIFALIKSWATIIKEERERIRQQEDEDKFKRGASHSTYFLFEEPELFLHPQAQRELFASLKELSETDNQVLITTHSSSFINLNEYKSIAIVHKDDFSVGTTVVQCNEELYLQEEDRKLFNLQLWFNSDRNEAFFAKKVILFEGNTEKVVLPFLAKKLSVHRHDYTLIDAGSKTAIPIYIHLFNCFKLKYVVVYDKDNQITKARSQKEGANKFSAFIEEKIDRQIGSSVVFENDIEEELNMPPGGSSKPFQALQYVSCDSYEITSQLEDKVKEIFS